MDNAKTLSEAQRLEQLWASDFGDAYVYRNRDAGESRAPFWREVLSDLAPHRVLEVGCNLGANLRWMAETLRPIQIYGVDVNQKALSQIHNSFPEVNAIWAVARELPFRDGWFDLVFTMGVLIHQPESTLPLVMSEIVRCSNRYVLCGEYYAESTTEVHYREQSGVLFKRDYGRLYQELFPNLHLLRKEFLGSDQGWDDVTYWIFEKAKSQPAESSVDARTRSSSSPV